MGTKATEKEDRLDRGFDARIDRLTDAYSRALDAATRASGSVTSNPLYRTSAEDRRVATAERRLNEARSALHRTVDVGEIARTVVLDGQERGALLRYVEGSRTSAQYDALTPPVQFAVKLYGQKEQARAEQRALLADPTRNGRVPVSGGRFAGDRIV